MGVQTTRRVLALSGGNLLVGSDFRLLGASSIEAEQARAHGSRARALAAHRKLDPRPLRLYGYGDPFDTPASPPLHQEPFHLDLGVALTGCRTARGEPVVVVVNPPRWREYYDEAAARLGADGFFVLRFAAPLAGSSPYGYSNVLVENAVRPGERRPLVFVPQFGDRRAGLRDHDRVAIAFWAALGFAPRPVGGWAPFSFSGGALRCAVKVLKRGPAPREERVISDATLRRLGRFAG